LAAFCSHYGNCQPTGEANAAGFALPAAKELLFATGFRWLSRLQSRMVNNQWLVKNFAIRTMNDL